MFKCFPCSRCHHIIKTFDAGWTDRQLPDGTIILTTPIGRTYTTKPSSALYFPTITTTSAPIAAGPSRPNTPDKATKKPTRQRSRARQRAYRITAARKLNNAYVAERTAPPPF
ncbi:MAG: hypothetical protein WBB07_15515 [Mycobacterium sp.]